MTILLPTIPIQERDPWTFPQFAPVGDTDLSPSTRQYTDGERFGFDWSGVAGTGPKFAGQFSRPASKAERRLRWARKRRKMTVIELGSLKALRAARLA